MKQFCKYHPNRAAHWYCNTCNRLLCPQCVDVRDMGGYRQGEKLHMCPKCNLELQWLGVGNIIDPFWKRMHRFFIYPLKGHPLVLMLLLSVVLTLFARFGFWGLLVQIMVWGVVLKYAFSILQNTAGGDLLPPTLSASNLSDNFGPVIKQVGIYVALFFAGFWVFKYLGLIAGLIFALSAILFLPAMLILLVTTESLVQAINPMMFVTLVFRIGWGYLLMYFFCSLLGGAPALLGQHVFQHFPPILQVFFFTLAKIYYTFISYHLMGYVILQYHEDIGYSVDVDDFRDEESDALEAEHEADTPESRLLLRVNQMVKDGDHQGALALIENETELSGMEDPLLSAQYYTLLKLTNSTDKLADHGVSHLALLVKQNDKDAAISAYRECLSARQDFAPPAATLFKLGGWLNESGDNKTAIETFNKLIKAFPADPLVPKSYFRAAQIFNDHMNNPEKAKRILNGLLKKFPDHDIVPFVERYLASDLCS